MALFNLADLCGSLPRGARLMGLDPGTKVIGVALSDVGLRLAGPYGQIRRGKLAVNAREIAAIARREEVGGLVVGLPLTLEGKFGPAAQAARDWARAISDVIGLPAVMWDERLTTSAVHDVLIEQAGLRWQKRATMVDRLAAAQILQSALDAAARASNSTSLEDPYGSRHP